MERPDQLDTSDIEGSQTRRPYVRSTPSPFNSNFDIEGTRPAVRTAHRSSNSQRHSDPLTPSYSLPSVIYDTSAAFVPEQPREVLWTVNKPPWRASTKPIWEQREPTFGAKEMYGRKFLFHHAIPARESMVSADITGPQFRIEETRHRGTDPLQPIYNYDGGPLDEIKLKRNGPIGHAPHRGYGMHGQMFKRSEAEDFALKTSDITNVQRIGCREMPKELIKTRVANRTDDILGAQANTWCAYPRLWKVRDPSDVPEKATNRVTDVEGAVTGTANKVQPSGGGGPPLYRSRIQAVRPGAPSMPYAHLDARGQMGGHMAQMVASRNATTAPADPGRAADIQAVHSLP